MRPLLAVVFILTCVMTFPRRSVGQIQFPPLEHEVLRGYLAPDVTSISGPPQITLRLTIDPEGRAASDR